MTHLLTHGVTHRRICITEGCRQVDMVRRGWTDNDADTRDVHVFCVLCSMFCVLCSVCSMCSVYSVCSVCSVCSMFYVIALHVI